MTSRQVLARPQPSAPRRAARPILASDARFLAFTFAFADLVVEFDEDWHVLYGIRRSENGPEAIHARRLSDLVDPISLARIVPLQNKLGGNARSEPIPVLLDTPGGRRRAVMRAYRARDLGGRISCVFTFEDAPAAPETGQAEVLLSPDEFLDQAARVLENPRALMGRLYFTFVELTGLIQTAGRALSPAVERMVQELEALLRNRSVGGASAGKVRDGRYVLLTDRNTPLQTLIGDMDGLSPQVAALLAPRASQAGVADLGSPQASIRALRFAIDRFFSKESNPDVALLAAELSSTLRDAGDFRMAVSDRTFKLLYQPIVRLADEKVSAYEALLRLPGVENTGASVRMAEQLGLIDALDVAVAEAAWSVLEADRARELCVCINISGRTLRDDGYVRGLTDMTRRSPSMRNRFTIEITEGAALEDLEAADRRVQALRRMGFKVCVDDFGAGAASFDYLRALNIDSIKIDGRYVREIAVSERSRQLVQHFVRLCEVLKIQTVGARTETRAAAEALKALGVDYAQGWYYGRPVEEPKT
jgi:EAL domain-containing protein (putative c-di-GMP-specific phosphodiesterase class I)